MFWPSNEVHVQMWCVPHSWFPSFLIGRKTSAVFCFSLFVMHLLFYLDLKRELILSSNLCCSEVSFLHSTSTMMANSHPLKSLPFTPLSLSFLLYICIWVLYFLCTFFSLISLNVIYHVYFPTKGLVEISTR